MKNTKIINQLFNNIDGFEKYCRKELWNNFENGKIEIDIEILLYYLRKFTKNNFLDLEYNLYGNEKKFNKIINELNIYYKNSNIKEIIDIIYFEGFYFENPDYINNFLNLIKIDLIKNNLKNKIMIWNNIDNGINIDKIHKEIKKLNYLIYSNFGNFLFKKIKGFKEYFYKNGYDNEDLIFSYIVCSVFNQYIKEKYLDKNYNLIGNKNEFHLILQLMNLFVKSNNKELSTLGVIGFIEGISQQVSNNDNMKNLRKLLFYSELQNGLDDVNNFWQGVND